MAARATGSGGAGRDGGGLSHARVAVYARFSSDRQSEASIDDQVARARRYAAQHGATVDEARVFTDYAVSAASMQRPGWEALMRAAEARVIDAILVEDLSRVSRKVGDTAIVVERLQWLGVRLIGIADSIDTAQGTSAAKVQTTIKSLMSDLYLDELRDKTLRGLEGRARAGLATGALPYGYRSTARAEGGHAIEIDDERAAVVRRIFDLHAAGWARPRIARALNAEQVPAPRSTRRLGAPGWMSSTIRWILNNERYIGRWAFGARRWVKAPGTNRRRPIAREGGELVSVERPELAIVTPEQWAAVHPGSAVAVVERSRARQGAGRRGYLLSGLLRCECGASMGIHGGDATRRYYRCTAAQMRGTCPNRVSLRESLVRGHVLDAIRDHLFAPHAIETIRTRAAARLVRAEARGEHVVVLVTRQGDA